MSFGRAFAMMASIPDLTFPSSEFRSDASANDATKTTPSVPNVQVTLKTVGLIARDEDEACLALTDVVATASAAGDNACVAAFNVDAMDFTVSRCGESDRCVRLVNVSSEDVGAFKLDVEYARGRVKADARVGDACVELNAPSIICFTNIAQRVMREVPPSSSTTTTPSPSGASDFPTISANFVTGGRCATSVEIRKWRRTRRFDELSFEPVNRRRFAILNPVLDSTRRSASMNYF